MNNRQTQTVGPVTNENIASIVLDLLDDGIPLVLASIISVQGSSPRHRGTKMIISAEMKSYGTIGGSLLEATVIREAKQVLLESKSKFMEFDLTSEEVDAGSMICGGKAVVLLDYIRATKDYGALFQAWYDAVLNGRSFYFITHFSDDNDGLIIHGHSLLFPDGKVVGKSPLSVAQQESLEAGLSTIATTTIVTLDNTRVAVDPVSTLKTLYCFGAGHVAVPTAHIAALVGFRIVIVDDRAEFANRERFPDASRICAIEDFRRALEGLEIDKNSFIVILTRGHQFDREVLEQALKTRASYIGMISSRKKRDTIYQALLATGVKQEELDRVYSPIGIAIESETPEEIAVSIVAQLIDERARLQK